MLLGIAILLALGWFLGYSVFPVSSGLIHFLLVLAGFALLGHLLRGRRTVR